MGNLPTMIWAYSLREAFFRPLRACHRHCVDQPAIGPLHTDQRPLIVMKPTFIRAMRSTRATHAVYALAIAVLTGCGGGGGDSAGTAAACTGSACTSTPTSDR